ncbi:MAG: hypothetical protein KF787_13025 [Phycisphaeraceae bacterium]|nr:hypothetical protein [Phycisphaerae bacterium]MBX3393558.1 hypothetical protein [Phycisphaeraceae bacterium]HRJ50502.1 hypothetical protein [Phycisphaerales bacterium]
MKTVLGIAVLAGLAMSASAQWSGVPFYHSVHNGDFVAAGASTRSLAGDATIGLSGLPAGATVKAAYLNWNYLTDSLGAGNQANVVFNGNAVSANWGLSASPDLCWGFGLTAAYYADVTSLVTGNGAYTLGGASDDNGLGEGATLMVVYDLAGDPLREVNLYDGVVSTDTSGQIINMPHNFVNNYMGGRLHFAINALDGQTFDPNGDENFYINGLNADTYGGSGFLNNPFGGFSDNLYDLKDGDAQAYALVNDPGLLATTQIWNDCIGHTMSGISFVIPAPSSAALLGLAGLVAVRRRR